TVKLRFWQRKGTDCVLWILCRDHKKWVGQIIRHAINRDALFFHCFKQRALRLRCRSVDLVDQYYLRKQRAAMKHEPLFGAIEDGITENISRQQITRKLNSLECERQRAC